MHYRTLGRTGLNVSEIGLGTEYLVKMPREHVADVIHEAIARGINYFDLIWPHPDIRDNMGAAFKGYRDQVFLTAHLGATSKDRQYKKTRVLAANETFFYDALERYQTEYVDVLILHNCDSQSDFDKMFREKGPLGLALRLKKEGKARFIGFSGHTVDTALQAVESELIDVLMFPINMTGNAILGKKDLLKTCMARGVGVVAMKPYGGGKLLQGPRTVRVARYQTGGEAFKINKTVPITPVQCLAYTLSQVGVCVAIPGCADVAQLNAALAYETATDEEKDFSEIITEFDQYIAGECVYCNHCLPCPSNIDIGETIRLLEMAQQEMTAQVRAAYMALSTNASDCIQCGACEQRCPFGVQVMTKMQEAAGLFI
ncbi:MAG: aldo/keto reductase [Anaerolineae bacterium]|nr:aldo/keto reductase [Anaerolineae bacterium]